MFQRLQRILRHRWLDDATTRQAIPPELVERLGRQVAEGEKRHTGEVRIYVEAGLPFSYLWRDATPRERAVSMFGKLGVWDTEQNNGVLVYLLLAEHAIEVVADRGVSRHVSPAQWTEVVQHMGAEFRAGQYEQGLTQAVGEVTALLERHFPAAPGAANANELPDAPVLG